jgi:hypothetical protein
MRASVGQVFSLPYRCTHLKTAVIGLKGAGMGKIYTTITVTNRIDQANAEDGVIPMEALGIEPELRTQSLRLQPLTEQDTYLTIL